MNDASVLALLKEWLRDLHESGEILFRHHAKELDLPPDAEYTSVWGSVLGKIRELEEL